LTVETITQEVEVDYTHKKQSGGSGQFARVIMQFKPSTEKDEHGELIDFAFSDTVVGGNVPKEYIPGVEKGVISQKDNGIIAGFPVIGFVCNLSDGSYHDVDSSVMAFEIAGRNAFKEAMQKAGPQLLEPMMKVEVVTPEEYLGDVIGDLSSRRGIVQGQDDRGNAKVVTANVPLANMFGYINPLRSMSSGRAQFSMVFSHYAPVPQNVADEIKEKMAG